ncbi:receptor-like protein 7 [Malus sylvestris]|uniref:receptor-like protein 7 n=1 Tax=Malus sylvestris TaxID=3752 RepID=UPI0021ABF978|nr:receptor-like protein 7 [Malus sylvestris]
MKSLLHFFLFLIIIKLVHGRCDADDLSALLRLKKISPPPEAYVPPKLLSWNSSINRCAWDGVTCSTDGHVIGLDVSGEFLEGGIDNSSSLFDLQHLQSLNLSCNCQVGNGFPIPPAIGKLTNLRYLNLSITCYTGQVPFAITRLTRLVTLDLSGNYNFGYTQLKLYNPDLSTLVQSLTELRELYLDGVTVSAWDTEWCQAISSSLPNLRVLSLSACNLSGPIDQSLAKLQSLSVIRLDDNDLPVPLPGVFANFSNLTSLSLRSCLMRGTFPEELFQVPTLQTVDLSDNPQLHGSFPEFPRNNSLRSLVLSNTKFSGILPKSIGNLKMLLMIDISGCSFSGSIPKSIQKLTQLVHLYMSSNRFSGPIDSIHWEKLVNLLNIVLDSNLLSGSIPSSIVSPPFLEELLLSHNQFSGQLHEFSDVSSYLVTLDLSFNDLEGIVPLSIYNFRGLETLDLSSNNFSGFHFNSPQQLSNLSVINLSNNSLLVLYNGTTSSYSSFPQIVNLNLASNKLRTFPDFFRNHTGLAVLDLSQNQIQGTIPNWIWGLISLLNVNLSCNSFVTLEWPLTNSSGVSELDLHSNQLQGQIPVFLPYAGYLDYSRNHFSSSIPTNIGNFLSMTRYLSLSRNNLHGIIPVSICNASLEFLDMSDNSLSGMIPQCLTAMSSRVLSLRRNNLTGTIPGGVLEYCSFRILDLGENQIEGQVPKSLANCTELEILNLGINQITDTFPCFLKNISTLRILLLRSNNLYGGIGCSETNGTWPKLQIIDLAHNNFSGGIPARSLTTWQAMMANKDDSRSRARALEFPNDPGRAVVEFEYYAAITVIGKGLEMDLQKILTIFTLIDFSGNKLSGSIPKELGDLKSLYVLNLSSNAFTGEIPSSLGNLQKLESLDLSRNKLSGQIPPEFAELNFLSFLNLSNNQLVGRIPTSTQFTTFPKASFIGNKGLWGPPLTVDSKAGSPPPPTLNESQQNSGDKIDWDLISVEIGFVFGFGIAVGSLVFYKRWSKWYYKAMYKILVKIFPQLEERIGPHVHMTQRPRR